MSPTSRARVIVRALLLVPRSGVHPFLDTGRLAFTHQGEGRRKSTIAAFRLAIEKGCKAFELDVWATRDGVAVVSHDDVVDGIRISEHTMDELDSARVDKATLEQVLLLREDLRVNVDTKSYASVLAAVEVVGRLDAWHRVCFAAFADPRVLLVRLLSRAQACTSMGPIAVTIAWLAAHLFGCMPRLGADCIQVPPSARRLKVVGSVPLVRGLRILTPRFVEAAHRAGLAVHAWTINDADEMGDLLDLGVDAIITDQLDVAEPVYADLGFHLDGRRLS